MAQNLVADELAQIISELVERVKKLLARQEIEPRERMIIALAGVPGSGKSTVSNSLLKELGLRGIRDVAVVPMDGFHHTQEVLRTFEDPELAFRRRGAPFTFDAEAFAGFVKTLKSTPTTNTDEPETELSAPSFDHALKDPIPDAIKISSRNRLIILEGNYTLLDEMPWRQIADCCEEKWFVDVPPEVAKDRLAKRHLAAGIETSMAQAIKRAEENDLPNGDLVRSSLVRPDVRIENV